MKYNFKVGESSRYVNCEYDGKTINIYGFYTIEYLVNSVRYSVESGCKSLCYDLTEIDLIDAIQDFKRILKNEKII